LIKKTELSVKNEGISLPDERQLKLLPALTHQKAYFRKAVAS